MTDIFEEVEEQLRSERIKTIFLKGWPWLLGVGLACLLAALAYWGYHAYRTGEASKASEAYASGLEALRKNDNAAAYRQFEAAAKSSSRGYRALALMQQGAIRLDENRANDAVKLFDEAAKVAPDAILGDMARLKSAFALMDTAPFGPIEQRLKPLTDAKRPYRVAAREALAMAEIKAGRLKEARDDFGVLRVMPDAPDATRQRAEMAIAAIDSGAAAQVPTAVKAALALPPPATLPVQPTQQPQAGAGQ